MKDVNGTGFQLLFGPEDWGAALATSEAYGLAWEPAAGSVALAVEGRRFPPRPGAARLTPQDRRGADADCFGNWYCIDAARRSIRTWRSGKEAGDYWSISALEATAHPPAGGHFADSAPEPERFAAMRLSGLAVTRRHHLLVGTLEPAGLLAFDLHAYGLPAFTLWPAPLDLSIFDLARAETGGAWLLDRGTPVAPARLWRLDDRSCLVQLGGTIALPAPRPSDFAAEGESLAPALAPEVAAGLDLSLAGPNALPGASAAVAVADLPDDTVLVLDAPQGAPARVLRYGAGGLIGGAVLDAARLDAFEMPPPALRGHDLAFLPDPAAPPGLIRGTVLVVDDQGDQALRFLLEAPAAAPGVTPAPDFDLVLLADYLPLRRFEGRALLAHEGRVFYDIGERWVALAADTRKRRRAKGVLGPCRFDSGQPGTEWHRVVFDGCVPPGTSVLVEVRAADDAAEIGRLPFEPLPQPYLRDEGSELPFWDPFAGGTPGPASGSWETLVQAGRGRLIDLRLTLTGDRRATPRLRALRLHAPRFSYLERYLPGIYREDAVSADFLGRFLANVEGLLTTMEMRVAHAYGLIDTRIAPQEALAWLAGWLGASFGPDWDDARQRLFIDHAELLFRWRGTPAGLKAMIDLATDPCPDASLFEGLRSGAPPEPDRARRGVRLTEGYARRIFGGPVPEPVPELAGWTAADGAAPLHLALANFALDRRGTDLIGLAAAWGRPAPFASTAEVRMAPLVPAQTGEAEDWHAFAGGPIGFAYAAAVAADAPAWRAFLARRYTSPARLAAAHGTSGFDPEALPDVLPEGGARLADWIDFVTGVLPVERTAHRFTVLAPVAPGEAAAARDARLERIAEVVARERPAHTAYEVRPYWALFQVGTARLDIDTALGAGARFAAIELGRSALGEGFVGYGYPLWVRDRAVIGHKAAGGLGL
jgi:phage tail-like protein